MLYAILILSAMGCIMAGNLIILPMSVPRLFILRATVVATAEVIAIDGLIATAIRRLLPPCWFDCRHTRYCATRREMALYEALGIKRWKDKVLELGVFTSFSKRHVTHPFDPDYTARFILESNYGIAIHAACLPAGFLVMLLYPFGYPLRFGLWVACVNAALNLLPLCILRYNLPRLHRLHRCGLRRLSLRQTGETPLCQDAPIP